MVNLLFKRNKAVQDPRVVDMMIVKAEMELEETLNQWKQRGHVLDLLEVKDETSLVDPDKDVDLTRRHGWLEAIVTRCEAASGTSHNPERLAKVTSVARAKEWGEMPGTQLAPLSIPGFREMWEEFKMKGRSYYPDKFLSGELQTDDGSVYHAGAPTRTPPTWLSNARDEDPERDEDGEEAFNSAAEAVALAKLQGRNETFLPIRSEKAKSKLPVWVASKIHYPWLPGHRSASVASDAKAAAALESELAAFNAKARSDFARSQAQWESVNAMFESKLSSWKKGALHA